MVGYAFTLRYAPAREDFDVRTDIDNERNTQRLAVERIGKDEVLVIDARGDIRAGALGSILGTRIAQRGAAGIVTDGALRDTEAFRNLELPTYASGAHAAPSSTVHHPADMNVPIGCAGILVMPRDVVVGDAESVVVIPASLAEEVAHDAYEQELMEEFILQKVQHGASIKGVYPPDDATEAQFAAWRQTWRTDPELR